MALALLGALLLPDLTLNTASLLAAELLLIAWYAWAMYLVTTPAYSSQYAFVGTDIVATSWYAAGLGLLSAAQRWRAVTTTQTVPPAPRPCGSQPSPASA